MRKLHALNVLLYPFKYNNSKCEGRNVRTFKQQD